MTRQIAVRLPDELIAVLDQLVAEGEASSRAAAVTHAVEAERRRQIAARDIAILSKSGADSEFDTLAEYAARVPRDDLD